jgi:hypothetical protein
MTKFARVSERDWVIDKRVGSRRIRRIKHAANFEGVVSRLVRGARVEHLCRERASGCHSAFRLIVRFRVRPESLDQFFNSSVGYRAQYFASSKLGERANRFTVKEFFPKVIAEGKRRKRPKKDFIEMSLKHPDCKVWPHQGEWLRRARCEDRVLLVPRWQAELTSGDKARQKLALWGSLAPAHETRLLLKGGFVQSTGRIGSIGKAPSNRSKQLHELGFT